MAVYGGFLIVSYGRIASAVNYRKERAATLALARSSTTVAAMPTTSLPSFEQHRDALLHRQI
jgi:hypothetical protein